VEIFFLNNVIHNMSFSASTLGIDSNDPRDKKCRLLRDHAIPITNKTKFSSFFKTAGSMKCSGHIKVYT